MTNEEYMKLALKTESPTFTTMDERLLHGIIGVSTEAGELLDAAKKALFYGRELDPVNVVEEVGDVFWYLAIICGRLNVSFEYVMNKNIAKLKARYPEQFTQEKATNRDLEKEREILEDNLEEKIIQCVASFKDRTCPFSTILQRFSHRQEKEIMAVIQRCLSKETLVQTYNYVKAEYWYTAPKDNT